MSRLVAGMDGTKKGWVCVTFDGDSVSGFGVAHINDALTRLVDATAIAIDVPIGFRDTAEPGGRQCEKLARALMPGRASSVFSSPCRAALAETAYPAASAVNRASCEGGRGLSKQSHALFPKMREVDAALTPALQNRVFEVHPEVSFTELARSQGLRITAGKKTLSGRDQRTHLLETAGLRAAALLDRRSAFGAQPDDILDAAVAAWTAHRRLIGKAFSLPADPPLDARGLRMEMWV